MVSLPQTVNSRECREFSQYCKWFTLKAAQVIVQSKLGEKIRTASRVFEADWFNLRIENVPEISKEVKSSLGGKYPPELHHVCIDILLETCSGDKLKMETWSIDFDPSKTESAANFSNASYHRMSALIRSVLCASRATPCYKYYAHRQGVDSFVLLFAVYEGDVDIPSLGNAARSAKVGFLTTPLGTLSITLNYRTSMVLQDTPADQPTSLLESATLSMENRHYDANADVNMSSSAGMIRSGAAPVPVTLIRHDGDKSPEIADSPDLTSFNAVFSTSPVSCGGDDFSTGGLNDVSNANLLRSPIKSAQGGCSALAPSPFRRSRGGSFTASAAFAGESPTSSSTSTDTSGRRSSLHKRDDSSTALFKMDTSGSGSSGQKGTAHRSQESFESDRQRLPRVPSNSVSKLSAVAYAYSSPSHEPAPSSYERRRQLSEKMCSKQMNAERLSRDRRITDSSSGSCPEYPFAALLCPSVSMPTLEPARRRNDETFSESPVDSDRTPKLPGTVRFSVCEPKQCDPAGNAGEADTSSSDTDDEGFVKVCSRFMHHKSANCDGNNLSKNELGSFVKACKSAPPFLKSFSLSPENLTSAVPELDHFAADFARFKTQETVFDDFVKSVQIFDTDEEEEEEDSVGIDRNRVLE